LLHIISYFKEKNPFNTVSRPEIYSPTKKNLIIIVADTMCVLSNVVYCKPSDKDDTFHMLKAFSNNTHQLCTDVCILQRDMAMRIFSETTDVTPTISLPSVAPRGQRTIRLFPASTT
jgi:predicted house-cleaning NTP pyrophosphatase (Maf/HAM1 superfamily)